MSNKTLELPQIATWDPGEVLEPIDIAVQFGEARLSRGASSNPKRSYNSSTATAQPGWLWYR